MAQAKILVTGATGQVGTELVKKLAQNNVPFKALVRTGDGNDLLKSLPQAEIVMADLATSFEQFVNDYKGLFS